MLLFLGVLLQQLSAEPTLAVTLELLPDPVLLAGADLVITGRVLGSSIGEDRASTRIYVEVDRVLRGATNRAVIEVRQPGVQLDLVSDLETPFLVVPGLPHFRQGQSVLLFLGDDRDSTFYRLHQLSLGAFFRRQTTSFPAAARDLLGAHIVSSGHAADSADSAASPRGPAPDSPAQPGAVGVETDSSRAGTEETLAEPLRDWHGFVDWITSRAAVGNAELASEPASTQYLLDANTELVFGEQEPFTFLGGSTAIRWFVFDQGNTLGFRAHQSGLAGAQIDVFDSLRIAARSWTRDPDSRIELRYSGTTSASAGLRSSDGVNTVLWDDPNNEIDGDYVCGQGGVLGLGGGFTLGTQDFVNGTARRLVEADVVINQGAGCFFNGAGGLDGQEILGHELGHGLGLGHTTVQPQQSLMRARAHGDGRGARLGSDDRAGIFFLYPGSNGAGAGRIEVGALTVLIGEAVGGQTLQLVRRAGSAGTASVRYRYVDLEARANQDYVPHSGTVTWADGQDGVREVPVTPLDDQIAEGDERFRLVIDTPSGAALGTSTTTVTIVDDETVAEVGSFRFLQRTSTATERSGSINVAVLREGSSNGTASVGVRLRGGSARRNRDFAFVDTVLNWPAGDLSVREVEVELFLDDRIELPETIVLELHSPSSGAAIGDLDRHVIDLFEAIAPGPCVAGEQSLCLAEGRFRVDSQWSTNGGEEGDGRAVLLTDDTGYFWFFDEANVEVTLKVLDACTLADRFWVFAGGLTSVEVRIRVVDTERDEVKVYASSLDQPFQPIQDTNAFATCP